MTDRSKTAYRPRTRAQSTGRRHSPPQPLLPGNIPLIAIGILVFLLFVVFADFTLTAGHVHPGVSVGGVSVGGMSPKKAAAALAARLPQESAAPITVTYEAHTWTAKPADLGILFDYDALVAQAMGYGRSSGLFGNIGQRFVAYFGFAHLPARAQADTDRLDTFVNNIVAVTDQPFTDAGAKMNGSEVVLTPAKAGSAVDKTLLTTSILTAFTAPERSIQAPVHVREADVSDASAQAARSLVATMLAQPATVTWGKQSWKLTVADLTSMLAFRKASDANGKAFRLEPYMAPTKLLASLGKRTGMAQSSGAKDARFVARSGVVKIVPARTGVGPDFDALSVSLGQALTAPTGQPRIVALHTHKTQPKLSTAVARTMGIKQKIAGFTTDYSPSVKPRVNNIHVLGNALDGKLVAPGATFSFNGAIGERTAAKGYQVANVIVAGKLQQALGGGICQVGTTLFNAVFKSGLPVVERHNHSFYISHYPKGRDATVSWDGPDLKFKNTTKTWLLVATTYTDSSISISLYGTDPGYTVSSTTGPFYDSRPFPTETVKDPKLPEGYKVVEDAGETGRTCVVTRTVKLNGEVVRTDTFKSVYRPKIEVVRVGTKKTAATSKNTSGTTN